jgi:hypothetical protein
MRPAYLRGAEFPATAGFPALDFLHFDTGASNFHHFSPPADWHSDCIAREWGERNWRGTFEGSFSAFETKGAIGPIVQNERRDPPGAGSGHAFFLVLFLPGAFESFRR